MTHSSGILLKNEALLHQRAGRLGLGKASVSFEIQRAVAGGVVVVDVIRKGGP